MSVSTDARKFAAINIGCPWRGPAVIPSDSSVVEQERAALVFLYTEFFEESATPTDPSATVGDAILVVTEGPTTNDGLMAWFAAQGAVGTTLQDLERDFLLAQAGTTDGTNNDLWMQYLTELGYTTGTLNDRQLAFWRAGGV